MGNCSADTPDAELAAAINASDHHAFKILYDRYFDALYRFIWRQVSNNELAKDLLQETFSRVWKSRAQLQARATLKSYLFRISHNLIIDHRRQHSRTVESFDARPEIAPSYVADERIDLHERVHAALQSLPEPVRLVFTMNRFDGLKYAEIAALLDISIKTVEARMHKALTLLREKLAPFLLVLLMGLSLIARMH